MRQNSEGIWSDNNGEIICLNSLFIGYSTESLLFKKEKLKEYLHSNSYELGWNIYVERIAEKQLHECWYNLFYNDGEFSEELLEAGHYTLNYPF